MIANTLFITPPSVCHVSRPQSPMHMGRTVHRDVQVSEGRRLGAPYGCLATRSSPHGSRCVGAYQSENQAHLLRHASGDVVTAGDAPRCRFSHTSTVSARHCCARLSQPTCRPIYSMPVSSSHPLVIEDQPIGVWRDPEHRHDVPQWFCIQKLSR